MDPRDFLDVAAEWSIGSREAEWRSAMSRAYYAAFHVARALLRHVGFAVPAGPQAHPYLNLRLQNSGQVDVQEVGASLAALRSLRNRADYDLDRPFEETLAFARVQAVVGIIRTLDDLAGEPTALARVVETIRDYERDVLHDVTFRAP
jgi:uncharacterized protein (UPF0332 family)